MTNLAARQIALVTVFATCALVVALTVAASLGADSREALVHAAPLAALCAVALGVLLADPFRSR